MYFDVWRGNDIGFRLTPHKYRDGRYRVRKSQFEPWLAVEANAIQDFLAKGYILRMSCKGHPPSGIHPKHICDWR
jgi:hypothetical protein